jgi:4-amino-4-deoxy-L-arabinose transferase-like glycosyltransferase
MTAIRSMKDTNKLFYLILFVLALIVNFSGLNVQFFTDDPGLYASVAKNLVYKKDFFQLFTYNLDWLDKPHFPFWVILLSFKLFGVSVWAYRLPALLFFLASLVYTFLFTRRYYNWEIASIAVLILMTVQHILLSNTDVRAEPYLMALLVGSIYHISRLKERFSFTQLFLAAILTACAVMTKGIFVIIPIYGSLLGELVFRKKLSHIFQLRWLWLLLLTFIFTLPEFYALYRQFDLHPEKTVFGRHQVSGIKWFLWDSQFGRFVNNGPISRKSSGSIFFYLHTLLWAFAPWCLLFYYAVYNDIKGLFSRQKRAEYYSLCGGLILLLLFSLSRFQLPFYTNAVFPLFAIITAPVCYQQLSKFGTQFRLIAQWVFVILLPVSIIVINFFLKPASNIFLILDCMLFGVIILLILLKIKTAHTRPFFLNCAAALFAGFYLNTVLYNEITPYVGQIAAAEYINQKPFDRFRLYTLTAGNNIYQFYCKRPVELAPIDGFNSFKSTDIPVFYANQQSLNYLKQTHADFKIIKSFINYPQENILPAFINKDTRYKVLDHVYLLTK